VGDYAGPPCTARHGLAALAMAVHQQCPNGARGRGISLLSDHGGQPTSRAFMQACQTRGIPQAFTRDNNPKGNAETERLMRTLTEECRWLTEGRSPAELLRALEVWIDYDNGHYWHASLGYKTPKQVEQEYQQRHSTPFVAA
jgi:putative transposase